MQNKFLRLQDFYAYAVEKPLIHNIDTNLWPGITSITLRAHQTRSALRKNAICDANFVKISFCLEAASRAGRGIPQ